ncbi:phage baseplate protein [Fusobacterium animalis]|uniref:phage baseplate protein n=1 Tax=Fusobacterium animalis TaxID=76859 RepID=UPI0030CB9F83
MISVLKGTVGIIQSINTVDYTATVQLPEYDNQITEGLQILSPITLGNKITSIPKVNTPVFCIFLGDDTERGFIIGSYFSDENVSNSQEDQYKIDFQGASLTIKEDGNIELKGTLTKIDSEVLITGDTTIEKSITVSNNATINGSMKAEKGFETNKATLKDGKLDVESIEYKEMTKK